MKRKVYTTRRERMTDQILGFLAFPLVNVPLSIISQRIDSLALPWLVNGILITPALLFRPEFAIGYVAFIAVAVSLVTALSVLFVAACFVSALASIVLGQIASVLFIILLLVGLYFLGEFAVNIFRNWWSSYKNNSH